MHLFLIKNTNRIKPIYPRLRLVYELRELRFFSASADPRRKMSRSLRVISLAIRHSSSLSIIQERPYYTRALGRCAQFLRGVQSYRFMHYVRITFATFRYLRPIFTSFDSWNDARLKNSYIGHVHYNENA